MGCITGGIDAQRVRVCGEYSVRDIIFKASAILDTVLPIYHDVRHRIRQTAEYPPRVSNKVLCI